MSSEGDPPAATADAQCSSSASIQDTEQKYDSRQDMWNESQENSSGAGSSTSFKDDHKFKTPAVPPRRLKERPPDAPPSRKSRPPSSSSSGRLQEPSGDGSQSNRTLIEPSTLDLDALCKEADAEVTRVNFNGDLLLLPSILVHSEYVFRQVVCAETYYSLSEEARAHLRQFLPPIKTVAEEQHALACAFTKRTDLVHGNPINKVQSKLKNGWFNPDRPSQQNQIRDNNKVLYDHYIRFYHMNLLNKLVKSRHVVLQHLMSTSALCSPSRVPMDPETLKRRNDMERIRLRAAKRTRAMIADCRMKVGESCISSDEEEEDLTLPMTKGVTLHTARSTLFTPNMKDLDLHQPIQMDDVKTMLRKFKKLRREEPHAPSLDITGIDLDDVYDRAGVLAQSEKIKQTMEALEKNLKKAPG
uniref:snRNA-activating protein complex subunit 3 n=1 Tax=Haemonchus contortus TaxID=6289 RepID=A0A7I4YB62_HAECO|nr:nuclear factor related to kappa-B-binding [Haemonchus contortus]